MANPKLGMFAFPGAAKVGKVVVGDIGSPPELADDVKVEVMTDSDAAALLAERPPDANKGTFGKVLIAAGCDQYRGAPVLAAIGAFRAGAGLVALAVPDVVRQSATIMLPEATYESVADDKFLTGKSAQLLLAGIDQRRVEADQFLESFPITFACVTDQGGFLLHGVPAEVDAIGTSPSRKKFEEK